MAERDPAAVDVDLLQVLFAQWDLFRRERPATAAEEIVRWATPVVAFQRTATQDTELGGRRVREGERVGLFYSSANHDPEVFDDPDVFDVTRDPNPTSAAADPTTAWASPWRSWRST